MLCSMLKDNFQSKHIENNSRKPQKFAGIFQKTLSIKSLTRKIGYFTLYFRFEINRNLSLLL